MKKFSPEDDIGISQENRFSHDSISHSALSPIFNALQSDEGIWYLNIAACASLITVWFKIFRDIHVMFKNHSSASAVCL